MAKQDMFHAYTCACWLWLPAAAIITFIASLMLGMQLGVWVPQLGKWEDTECRTLGEPVISSSSSECLCNCQCLALPAATSCQKTGNYGGTIPYDTCDYCYYCGDQNIRYCDACQYTTWHASIKFTWYNKIHNRWHNSTLSTKVNDHSAALDPWIQAHDYKFPCSYPRIINNNAVVQGAYNAWYNRAVALSIAGICFGPLLFVCWIIHVCILKWCVEPEKCCQKRKLTQYKSIN